MKLFLILFITLQLSDLCQANNKSPYRFPTAVMTCEDCKYLDGDGTYSSGYLRCDKTNAGSKAEQLFCTCEDEYLKKPNVPRRVFEILSYKDGKNCSAGKFGPCFERNGIEISCHGPEISCVDGTCVNPKQKTSKNGEDCELTKNCDKDLICNRNTLVKKCIISRSTPRGEPCAEDQDCASLLFCKKGEKPDGSSHKCDCIKNDLKCPASPASSSATKLPSTCSWGIITSMALIGVVSSST